MAHELAFFFSGPALSKQGLINPHPSCWQGDSRPTGTFCKWARPQNGKMVLEFFSPKTLSRPQTVISYFGSRTSAKDKIDPQSPFPSQTWHEAKSHTHRGRRRTPPKSGSCKSIEEFSKVPSRRFPLLLPPSTPGHHAQPAAAAASAPPNQPSVLVACRR